MRLASPLAATLAILLVPLLPAAVAHGAGDDHAVLADPAAELDLFPTASEVQDAIAATAGDPWFTVHTVGASADGRPIQVVEVTDPDPAAAVPRDQRVVTLLETQQHGNEPAGTGAAVPLLRDLVAGEGRDHLRNQILLLLPMSNPDGATAATRENRDGIDINRDHVGLVSPEAQAMHAILRRWDVHVAIDHHEYGGTGLGNPVPVRVYDFDLTLMYPNHGNVRRPTFDLAQELDYDVLWPAAQAAGYSVGDYGITTVNGIPVQQTAGGPDPGILRNSFGLNNVAGLLAETFVTPTPDNPFQNAERRIAIHRLVMDTTLEWASQNADRLIAAKRESERLNVGEPATHYDERSGEAGATAGLGEMAPAYRTAADLSALFGLHGLSPGTASADGGFVHAVHGEERGGLVAAMLHPASSRRVVTDAAPAALPAADLEAGSGASRDAAGLGPCLALAALAAAFAARRRLT